MNKKNSLLFVVGSMVTVSFLNIIDAIVTIVGVRYYGFDEINPLIKGLVINNPLSFFLLKALISGFLLFAARKNLVYWDSYSRDRLLVDGTVVMCFFGLITYCFITVWNFGVIL